MKFGRFLEARVKPEWRSEYVDYKALKDLIKQAAAESDEVGNGISFSPRTTSLTVQRGNRKGAEERFFEKLESEARGRLSAFLPAVHYPL